VRGEGNKRADEAETKSKPRNPVKNMPHGSAVRLNSVATHFGLGYHRGRQTPIISLMPLRIQIRPGRSAHGAVCNHLSRKYLLLHRRPPLHKRERQLHRQAGFQGQSRASFCACVSFSDRWGSLAIVVVFERLFLEHESLARLRCLHPA